jgi:hypothetical protein
MVRKGLRLKYNPYELPYHQQLPHPPKVTITLQTMRPSAIYHSVQHRAPNPQELPHHADLNLLRYIFL